jgi:hypothetical protein
LRIRLLATFCDFSHHIYIRNVHLLSVNSNYNILIKQPHRFQVSLLHNKSRQITNNCITNSTSQSTHQILIISSANLQNIPSNESLNAAQLSWVHLWSLEIWNSLADTEEGSTHLGQIVLYYLPFQMISNYENPGTDGLFCFTGVSRKRYFVSVLMSIGRTGCSTATETRVLSLSRFLNRECKSQRFRLRIQGLIFSTYYF